MPKSFLFTNRRYNNETCPLPLTDPVSRSSVSSSVCYLSGTLSPDQASEAATASSPARPQAARMTSAPLQVPEEMYNLLQLAEVSLATSGTSNPSILERWREEWARMTLKNSKVSRNLSADFRMMDQEFSVLDYEPPLEKPLDLSRDHSEVRILTPSPSPAPSIASSDNLEIHIPDSTDLKKGFESESSNDTTSISSKSTASKHSEHHEGHECPECGKRYSTSSNLARHRQTHRSPADQKARRCPHCDKVYVSVPAFSMHVRTHSQGCKCPYCGKAFSRPWLLQGHIRTHTGEKPFRCQVCEKAFADKSNLRAHVQTHSNLKPYVCERCGKAFALKSYLYKHEESSCMKTSKTKA